MFTRTERFQSKRSMFSKIFFGVCRSDRDSFALKVDVTVSWVCIWFPFSMFDLGVHACREISF